jgi:hypothetical protein
VSSAHKVVTVILPELQRVLLAKPVSTKLLNVQRHVLSVPLVVPLQLLDKLHVLNVMPARMQPFPEMQHARLRPLGTMHMVPTQERVQLPKHYVLLVHTLHQQVGNRARIAFLVLTRRILEERLVLCVRLAKFNPTSKVQAVTFVTLENILPVQA